VLFVLDVTEISTVVAAVSVVVGVIFTVLELRHMTRTRQTDLIMRMYESMAKKDVWEMLLRVGGSKFTSFEQYAKEYGLTDAAEVLTIFEGVGILLEQKLIDIRLVDRLFGGIVGAMWEKLAPVLDGMRKSLRDPYLSMHFEYLYHRMRVYRGSDQWKKDYGNWKKYREKYGIPNATFSNLQ
jgi:hypothetical protein